MSSKVYFIKASIKDGEKVISRKARKLFKAGGFAGCFKKNDFTAVKVHVGEDKNNTHIKAPCIKGLVDELLKLETKPFVTDTTTLYVGQRHNAIDHSTLAAKHGFGLEGLGIPFIVPDGLFGTSEIPVEIDGEIDKQVYIASGIVQCQSLLSVAHFTGHPAACAAATLKTLGMGCASKKGKMKQHAALKLSISNDCTCCGVCFKHCPADAITLDDVKAHIDQDKCIGCAECMAMCRFGAVKCNWGPECEVLQKSIAEYALGVLKGKENKAAFFNFLLSVTKDCDCFGMPNMGKIVDDIGIAASTNPVALDKATLDLVENKAGRKLAELLENDKLDPCYQIEHAERIGLGSSSYELIEVD
ncbi:MAG TPA: DUF362 domain-containing protein [Sedimentisphaerales bacterium]|nr:DUF362 domain-containing protein [Sedimentisphaerales bacterium]